MRIRMLIEMTGTRDGQSWPKKGDEAELPTAQAAHLVASGVAEQVDEEQPARKQPKRGGRRADGGSA
ncbi:hypothetical protein ABZ208_35375 [Streptomyces sp. NPDC006208]|uniref:hypothetical protein n=1 Tax=Streptomyces sp. NPDC006208 TaxID=3156734 RepID=UPI00339E6D1C